MKYSSMGVSCVTALNALSSRSRSLRLMIVSCDHQHATSCSKETAALPCIAIVAEQSATQLTVLMRFVNVFIHNTL